MTAGPQHADPIPRLSDSGPQVDHVRLREKVLNALQPGEAVSALEISRRLGAIKPGDRQRVREALGWLHAWGKIARVRYCDLPAGDARRNVGTATRFWKRITDQQKGS